jgi:glycogen(starch) synthase
VLSELRDVCEHITEQVGERLFHAAATGEQTSLDALVDEYWTLRLRRTQQSFRSKGLPPVVTHQLEDEVGDGVLNQIRSLWMFNRADDPVKVVYHPQFIAPDNPLWGIEYDQFVRGCHMGLFPSSYEPWGYTPLECAAVGVPSVSSDLAGFGRYVQENVMGHEELGLHVLRRRGRSFHDAAAELCRVCLDFCRKDRRERIALRSATERQAAQFDWGRLGAQYDRAHTLALERAGFAGALTP